MRPSYLLLTVLALATTMWSCLSNHERTRGRDLSEFQNTVFVPTLENSVPGNKNAIYCATFLYAWEELKKIIPEPLAVDTSLHDLYLLNKSTDHINTLTENEYSRGAEINGLEVGAWAEFRKSLPFEAPLTSFEDELTFGNVSVASFGTRYHNTAAADVIRIMYYRNDDNFLLKLLPENKDHEIWLYMGSHPFENLGDIFRKMLSQQEFGRVEMNDDRNRWRFTLNDADEVVIPKLNFNIETQYPTLTGLPLTAGDVKYNVKEAWQRIEFNLDEKGAEIESEALVAADSVATDEQPRPKKLRFNKPFFILLKRADSPNPYFCMWVANPELMQKSVEP